MKRAAIAYLLLVLLVGLLVTLVMPEHSEEEEAQGEEHAALPAGITPGPEIAERVAAIRGDEFEGGAPKVEIVPRAELEERLATLDEQPPDEPDLAVAAATLFAQAGALPEREAARLATRRHAGTGVLGAYLPEENVVLLDQEHAESDPEAAEAVAAGELSRALDSAGEDAPRIPPLLRDDEAVRVALTGGAATFLAREYAREHLESEVDLQAARDSRRAPETPEALQTLARIPDTVGATFVAAAHDRGGWKAVDETLGDPPPTTNALLHRDAGDAAPSPRFSAKAELGKGWNRLATTDFGELDTVALLRGGASERAAFKAAAGWRAGRFELWVQGSRQCPPPCRAKGASVLVHRWGDVADALTFNRAMRDALVDGDAQAEPEGGRGFTIGEGGAALVRAGRFTALVFAPDAPLAGRLAESVLEG